MKLVCILMLLPLAVNYLHAQLNFSVSTDKTVYQYGDSVFVSVKATNNSSIADTLLFGSCFQANYFLDSLNWAQGFAWCQHTSFRIVLPQASTIWGRDYFQGYPYPHSGVPLLGAGRHAVIGQVARYWTSDTLWIEVTPLAGFRDPAAIPPEYALENNYPNPFNPSTTIRYALPQRSHVALSVFNTLGQQVATLVNESQEAGYHDVRFDGSGLASGVYFYRLMAGDYVATKKLLLIR